MASNTYKPTGWTKFLMYNQLVILSLLYIVSLAALMAVIRKANPEVSVPLAVMAFSWSFLGVVSAVQILRGRASAWWLQSVFLIPVAIIAVTEIPEIRFGSEFREFMDGFVDSFQVLFLATAPLECIRVALHLRKKEAEQTKLA